VRLFGDTRRVSAENVEVIRRGYEAFQTRGEEAIFEFLDPEVEVRPIDEPPVGLRSYRGHEGFRRYLADTREVWGRFGWEAGELIDAGESVVARTRFYAEGRASGLPVEATVYIVWVVRDGKAVSARGYLDRDEALAAARVPARADQPRLD
jgi:ketosteroid isomerase-like protein